ncbi:MAG TPA: hypothetical protein VNA19_07565 [Pyrinomonadaceae bacterium]|nr:hypothetical protein [Pyrinomonadaceae bacterium]
MSSTIFGGVSFMSGNSGVIVGGISVTVTLPPINFYVPGPTFSPVMPLIALTGGSGTNAALVKHLFKEWTTKNERTMFASVMASNFISRSQKKHLLEKLSGSFNNKPREWQERFKGFKKELRALNAARLEKEMHPSPVPLGADYYERRMKDFVHRHPGVRPPAYYMSYGNVYLKKFSALNSRHLSPAGLAWRDRTLKNLQAAIESQRYMTIPWHSIKFGELEMNNEQFTQFAFETHPKAYIDAGLFDLPAQDLLVIAGTADLMNFLTSKDRLALLQQIATVLMRMKPEDLKNIIDKTAQDRRTAEFISFVSTYLADFLRRALGGFVIPSPVVGSTLGR